MGPAAESIDRRRFLAGTGAVAATLLWARVERVPAAVLGGAPPGFPAGVPLSKQRFETWSGEIVIDALWTAAPTTAEQVREVASWALRAGYKVRARGFMHNWSPLTVTPDTTLDDAVVLVDLRALAAMQVVHGTPGSVRVGAGASMEALLGFLDARGHGIVSVPAVGQITVGGALAIGGHGAVVPAAGELPAPGEAYGSLSNLVLALTAVVWDPEGDDFVLRTFTRADPELPALLVHLGRTVVTEVVLQVGPARRLRCRSIVDTPADVAFAPPVSAGPESFAAHLERTGRVESILFPFADAPWTKVWSVTARKPLLSRPTTGPYGYAFSDNLPAPVTALVDQLTTGPGPHQTFGEHLGGLADLVDGVLAGDGSLTPALGRAEQAVTALGVKALLAQDLWGPAFHTQLYIKATTLRYAEFGLAILCRRADVQWVVHQVATRYRAAIAAAAAVGSYPINGPLELRASGLDLPADGAVPGATPPTLSASHPRADHPEWDTVVWVNVLTFPGTPGAGACFTELEAWARRTFSGDRAAVRVEWSKGWAHTEAGPWTDGAAIGETIPDDHRAGRDGASWDTALAVFDALDPHRVFTNPFLDRLLPAPASPR